VRRIAGLVRIETVLPKVGSDSLRGHGNGRMGSLARTDQLRVIAYEGATVSTLRGCSSMVEHQLPKLAMRVRFPSSAPNGLVDGPVPSEVVLSFPAENGGELHACCTIQLHDPAKL
jgi:hypothetical protein